MVSAWSLLPTSLEADRKIGKPRRQEKGKMLLTLGSALPVSESAGNSTQLGKLRMPRAGAFLIMSQTWTLKKM